MGISDIIYLLALSSHLMLVFMAPFCIITCVSNVGVGLVVVVVMVEAAWRG